MSLSTHPKLGASAVDSLGPRRMVFSTGLVTVASTRTTTAGFLFGWRRSSSAATQCAIGYIGARFTCTTAYGTAQRTGCDVIVARSFTAPLTGGTAIDMGSTLTGTGKLATAYPTSIMGVANQVVVATTGDLTAGTHTLDSSPIGTLVGWTAAIGDQVPDKSCATHGTAGWLFGAPRSHGGNPDPLILAQNEGFIIRNYILMGATGVGTWDFTVEWDEGTPR